MLELEPADHLTLLYAFGRLICEVRNGSMNRGKNSKPLMPWDVFKALRVLERQPSPEQEIEIAKARAGYVEADED